MKEHDKETQYLVCGSAPSLWPVDMLFGLFYYNEEEALEIPRVKPLQGEWGGITSIHVLESDGFPFPNKLDVIWLSIAENKFYSLETELNACIIREAWYRYSQEDLSSPFTHLVLGMAPFGKAALWLRGENKSQLISWMKGEQFKMDDAAFKYLNDGRSPSMVARQYIHSLPAVKDNLEENGLPPRDLFDKYMQQFRYRYVVEFGRWNQRYEEWKEYQEGDDTPVFDYIEESLFDGTHDKLHDGGLMEYHDAGKPKKIAVVWHIGKSDYQAYFWMDNELMRMAFDHVFGNHPDHPTDFRFHIDPKKNEYQLSLQRQGEEEPNILSDDCFQLIVFKSKFEQYRSKNYDQPSGAWIW